MTELMPSLCNDCVARNQCGKDDIKMCASYVKEVKIKCDDCKFVEDCVDYGWDGCKKFTPTQKPMTNEEWLRSCNTEQLAELIALICGSNILSVWRIMYHCADSDVDAVKMWLKKPHSFE